MAGLLPTIANMFRPTQQVQVVAAPLAQVNPGAGAGATVAAGASLPINTQAPPDPMADLVGLFQNDPKLAPVVDPLSTPLFNTDPAKIAAAAGKMDFTKQIAPDLMAKAMSGTDPAAFMQVINHVAQQTLATGMQLQATTLEHATAQNNQRVLNSLPGRVKQIQLDSLVPENPVLAHEGSQPMLKLLRSQVAMKNPGMSAVDINAQAEKALLGFAGAINAPVVAEVANQQAAQEGTNQDWGKWAGIDT